MAKDDLNTIGMGPEKTIIVPEKDDQNQGNYCMKNYDPAIRINYPASNKLFIYYLFYRRNYCWAISIEEKERLHLWSWLRR